MPGTPSASPSRPSPSCSSWSPPRSRPRRCARPRVAPRPPPDRPAQRPAARTRRPRPAAISTTDRARRQERSRRGGTPRPPARPSRPRRATPGASAQPHPERVHRAAARERQRRGRVDRRQPGQPERPAGQGPGRVDAQPSGQNPARRARRSGSWSGKGRQAPGSPRRTGQPATPRFAVPDTRHLTDRYLSTRHLRTPTGEGRARWPRRAGRARSSAAGAGAGATCGCTSRRMGAYDGRREIPIIVRGEGCYVWDEHGNRYLDGLSALFCVNIGHGRADVAQAGADQAKELGFFTNWSYAHPRGDRARRADRRARPRRPQPRLLHQRRLRGGRVRDQARRASTTSSRGNPNKTKIIAREVAYHGTTLGALSATGITALRAAVRAAHARRLPRPEHEPLPAAARATTPRTSPRRSRERIEFEGPEHGRRGDPRAGPERRRLLHAARGLLRSACARSATSYDVLLISDEVICSWGRLGEWFGAQRYGYQPDIITTAKGITSAYAPMGAVIASDRDRRAVPARATSRSLHGFTFGGHPMSLRGRAWRTSTSSRARASSRTSARTRARSATMLDVAARHPDRRRRARRGLLPGDRARQGPRDEGDLRRRRVRDAAARLPLRRAVPPRPDLPRRRPRRPGHPALPAADRRARSSSRRSRRSCARCSRRRRAGCIGAAAVTRRDAHRPRAAAGDLDVGAPRRRGAASTRRSAGCTSPSCADPTPWLSGGELLLTTGHAARRRPSAQRDVRRAAGRPRARRARLRDRASRTTRSPRRCSRPPRERGFPLFEVPYEMPFIAVTERAFTRARQRAVRAAAALDRRAGAPAADRAQRARAGRDRRGARHADRRRAARLRRPRRAAGAARVPPRAAEPRRSRRSAPSCASGPARGDGATRSRPPTPSSRGARSRCPWPRRPTPADGALPQAWLVGDQGRRRPGEFDRLLLHQAVTVVALELLRRRVAGSTERRLAGDVLAALVARRARPAPSCAAGWSRSASATRVGRARASRRGGAPAERLEPALDARAARRGGQRAGRRRRAISSARWCPASSTRSSSSWPSASHAAASPRPRRTACAPARAAPSPAGDARRSLPRGALRARGAERSALGAARQRQRPATAPGDAAGRDLPRPRLLPAAALAAGHRGAAALLRLAARPDRATARATTAAS